MQINQTFKSLIPPLSSEEYTLLKESIIKDGVRDSLIVWNDTLIDGHNRFEICTELGLPYKTVEMQFEDETAAKEWIMKNQLGRRNLPDVVRGRLALQLKDSLAARAKERMIATQNNHAGAALANLPKQNAELAILPNRESVTPQPLAILPKLENALNTRKELSELSGLSERTIAKIDTVDRTAPEPIKQAMGNIISIDKAYKLNKELQAMPKQEREEKAQSLVMQAYERESTELSRRQRISSKLENMVFNISCNGSLITEQHVGYMLENKITASEWIENIDRALELLNEMKAYLKEQNKIRRIK